MNQAVKEMRDRILQILNQNPGQSVDLVKALGDDSDAAIPEIEYLLDHGLIYLQISRYADNEFILTPAKITTKGRDYLDTTGGIGAELNLVTVKLHEDTIRQLLINRVRESDADDTVKGKLVDQIKSLPAEGISKLAEKALDQALRYMPHAIQWLQTAPWN